MNRMMQALAFVIVSTMLGGTLGGVAGRLVGQHSPTFVRVLAPLPYERVPPDFPFVEFATGIGIVSGLFLGVGSGLFVTLLMVLREAWLEGLALIRSIQKGEAGAPPLSRQSSASAARA